MSEGRLEGRVALITGGARGQGEAAARRFVDEGASVIITDVLDEQGRALADEIGGRYLPLDVTSEASWQSVMSEVGSIDVLLNNAGVLLLKPFALTSLEEYRHVIEVNQVGVFLGLQAAAGAMNDGGSIINVSSIDGLVGSPGVMAYAAAKFAVRGMTKVAALELAHRQIRVNSIHPGLVRTPMATDHELAPVIMGAVEAVVPLRRAGEAGELANLALFLASEESSYCTGAEFVADGGLTAGVVFPVE